MVNRNKEKPQVPPRVYRILRAVLKDEYDLYHFVRQRLRAQQQKFLSGEKMLHNT